MSRWQLFGETTLIAGKREGGGGRLWPIDPQRSAQNSEAIGGTPDTAPTASFRRE